MAATSTLNSQTIELIGRLNGSIIAKGTGYYNKGSIGMHQDIKLGFVYSTQPISITTTVQNDTLITASGQIISSSVDAGIYNSTSTTSWDYSLMIGSLLPNTTYYVRAYCSGYLTTFSSIVTKYGAELSITTSGASGARGYYISDTTVGFYDPLQIREASEGVERVLISDSAGLATWRPVSSLFSFGHYIGERYGGGIVAAVWREGEDEKVLIVAETDIAVDTPSGPSYTPAWSYGVANSTLIGSSAQSKYNGYLNTAAIVAQTISLGTTYAAAVGAAAYRGGDFEDWYLPSYYELNQVFNNMAIINKVINSDTLITTSTYLTSTEYSSGNAYVFSEWGGYGTSTFTVGGKNSLGRVRPVRKESTYTGDGLILNMDATKKNSFSDTDYLNLGINTKWKDIVNGGMTSSYSFNMSAYPTMPLNSETTTAVLLDLETINLESLAYRLVGSWWLDKMSGTSTPTLYNNTGASSMTSVTFSVPTGTYTYMQFDTIDQSTTKSSFSATVNVYVSVYTNGVQGAWTLVRQVSDTVGDNNNGTGKSIRIPLYHYSGKVISLKITAPNASYTNTVTKSGPSVDNIYVRSSTGGYQPLGPVYSPSESGYLFFNGTGSMTSEAASFGSYLDIKVPIGTSNTATVEIWMRMKDGYQTRMPFAWTKYSIFTGSGGGLGFNTGNSDLFGIDSARVQSLKLVGNWAHFVFEMRQDVSYTNNKMYINGNEQVLSQLAGVEDAAQRKFFNGDARIGGWRSAINNKLYMFRGDISVVRIYNRALTKDEIMKNYSFEKKRYEIRPELMKNSLIASIDFDNPASYSGDGNSSGSVSDLSGNGRAAILEISGTTVKPAVQKTMTLYNGKELVFPGTTALNPYLYWSTNGNSLQTFTNVSVSFWVKFREHRIAETIVKWNSFSNIVGPWEVFQSVETGTSTMAFRLNGSTGTTLTKVGTKSIQLDRWTHVCAIYDNATKKMKTYIDGVIDIDSYVSSTFFLASPTGDIFVGQYPVQATGNRYPMYGSIANIQIYSKALSYGEVKNNYDTDKLKFDNFNDADKFYTHEINGNPTFSVWQNMTLDLGNVSNEKILKLNSSGYSKWVDKSSLLQRPTNYRYIGELYGGGIIVAMWYYPKTIFNYLIMSLEDISAGSQWSNVTNLFAGATSEFKGNTNQATIIAQGGHVTSAAKLCDDYTGGGFTDWYLPSAFEMNQAFNAAGIVNTVLGTDKLDGTYWTSTEPYNDNGTLNALSYSFVDTAIVVGLPTGIQRTDLKTESYKVRAFRLATNAIKTRPWDPTWDEEYTPWWDWNRDPTYWEMDWSPATYNIWDLDYFRDWRRTSVSIDILPAVYQVAERAIDASYVTPQGYVSMTFSNPIYGYETVLSSGVCWSTASTTPTISDSVAYSVSGKTKTPDIMGISPGTEWDIFPIHFVYLRAFVTTPSGTYYSTNSGAIRCSNFTQDINGAFSSSTLLTVGPTYSTNALNTAYASYPTGCLVFHRNVLRSFSTTTVTSGTIDFTPALSTQYGYVPASNFFMNNNTLTPAGYVVEFGVCYVFGSPYQSSLQTATVTTANSKVVGSGPYSQFSVSIPVTVSLATPTFILRARAYAIINTGTPSAPVYTTYYGAIILAADPGN